MPSLRKLKQHNNAKQAQRLKFSRLAIGIVRGTQLCGGCGERVAPVTIIAMKPPRKSGNDGNCWVVNAEESLSLYQGACGSTVQDGTGMVTCDCA